MIFICIICFILCNPGTITLRLNFLEERKKLILSEEESLGLTCQILLNNLGKYLAAVF